jgi:thiamine transporter ThiT
VTSTSASESGSLPPTGPQEPGPGAAETAGGATGAAVFALVVAVMALVSSWTGWGGMVLGLVALVAALVALMRVRSGRAVGRAKPVTALVVGLVAFVVGTAVQWPTLESAVTYLHASQARTLDECMRQAINEKEQHVCKSQHLAEYRARYPGRLDP